MCGIVGYYGLKQKQSIIQEMLHATTHRGTDNTSYEVYNKTILGFYIKKGPDFSPTTFIYTFNFQHYSPISIINLKLFQLLNQS